MTIRPQLRHNIEMQKFLRYRRVIRQTFASRQSHDRERKEYKRLVSKLKARESAFDKNRIKRFEELQAECQRDIDHLEAVIGAMITGTYECMASLSTFMTPQERAWLVGATPQWLAQRNPDWESQGLFHLYFNLIAESEKSRSINSKAMYWYCGLMVSRDKAIYDMFMEGEDTEPSMQPRRAHLSLVR
jgi:hypothetical protein